MIEHLQVGEIVAGQFEVKDVILETPVESICSALNVQSDEHAIIARVNLDCSDEQIDEIRQAVSKLRPVSHKTLLSLKDFVTDENVGIFILENPDGETLQAHLSQRRENGQVMSAKVAYSILTHICLCLDAIHNTGHAFGFLSPYSIFITKQGRVRVLNFICAWLAQQNLDQLDDRNPSLPFIAPELQNQIQPTQASDVYTLSLIFAELISATPFSSFNGSIDAFIQQLPNVSAQLKNTLLNATQSDPEKRFQSLQAFRDALKDAIDAPADSDLSSIVVGIHDLQSATNTTDNANISHNTNMNPPQPKLPEPKKADMFDSASPAVPTARGRRTKVWIFTKNGIDYGPFEHGDIIKRFRDDEIDERTPVSNTLTKLKQPLGYIDEFKEEVEAFIPTRDKNRQKIANDLRKKQTRNKAIGSSSIVILVCAALVVIITPLIAIRMLEPPKALPLNEVFKPFEKEFAPPKLEEVSLNMDASQSKALFDPKATEAEREAALAAWEAEHRKKYAGKSRANKNANSANNGEIIDTLVFGDENGVELEPLDDWEIREQIQSPRVIRKQSECFQKYSGGRSVSGDIRFVINQNGTTRNFSSDIKGDLGTCLIESLSSLKFRQFGGTVKRVTVPFG